MGKSPHCRILFWNIMHGGGSRADGIAQQVLEWNPHIVAFAEFRGTTPSQSIAQRLFNEGFEHQLSAVNDTEPNWNAVFLASRFKLTRLRLEGEPKPDLYWLFAKVDAGFALHVGVVHAPWAIRFGRLEYYAALVEVAKYWQHGPGVIIGDTNTGITGLDEETEDSACYHDTVTKPMTSAGWLDMFRLFHPDADAPTWYSSSGNGRRLDQAFANAELQDWVISCAYDWGDSKKHGNLSDHAAILLDISSEGGLRS